MPIVNDRDCKRLGRIIYTLVKTKRVALAAKLLKTFAFDPIAVMSELGQLEQSVDNRESFGIKNIIRILIERGDPRPLPPDEG